MTTHILVIRPGAIGDTLLTMPLLQGLRTRYQQTHITFVGNATVLPLLLTFNVVDQVFDYEDALWSKLFLPLQDVVPQRKARLQDILERTEIAICWMRDPDGIVQQNLQSAGCKEIIVAPSRPADTSQEHITSYLARTIHAPWQDGENWQAPAPYAWSGPQRDTPIVIHPGSGGAQKCWPLPFFATLIQQLWEQEIPVTLLAGPAEHKRLVQLQHLLKHPAESFNYRVLTNAPLLEIVEQLKQCRAYVGNDTGITHLAGMLGVPTVALFGPSNPALWHPIGKRVRVLHAPELGLLSPDVVMHRLTSFNVLDTH